MGTPVGFFDGVVCTFATLGTGTITLGNAVTGYFDPTGAQVPSGTRVGYVLVDSLNAPTIREYGEGVLSFGASWTLTRATIRRSLSGGVAGGSAINWAAGTKYVFLTPLAANLPSLETDGNITLAAGASIRAQNTAKAWAVHNGSALLDSHGIASVVDNGVGDITFNFATAFATANYCIIGAASMAAADGAIKTISPRSDASQITASSCRILCGYHTSATGVTLVDVAYMSVAFFGDP